MVGATWFVATNGVDTNAGTSNAPFATIMRAQTAAATGDTVWLRGGTYYPTNITATNLPWKVVNNMTKNGISYIAYSGELPIFDFSQVKLDPPTNRVTAFQVTAKNCVFKGFDVVGVPIVYTNVSTQSECFRVDLGGDNNRFELLRMRDGNAIGFYLRDGINNLVLNCDAYNNKGIGSQTHGNIDGFGFHAGRTTSTGNVIRGCRAWNNSDDGYDLINNKAVVIMENCWAFYNGYFTNGTLTGGNANGFKCGGYGVSGGSYPVPPPRNVTRFCLAVGNGANGFYANFHPDGLDFINNTAIRNAAAPNPGANADFNMICIITNTARSNQISGFNHLMRNNIALQRTDTNSLTWLNTNACDVAYNYFTRPVTVSSNDFMSLDESLLTAPRQSDGGLPYIAFAQLVGNSDLLNAGTNVGFVFVGGAPDLGVFEYGSQPPPALAMTRIGANLVFTGSGGPAGGTNYLVGTTNPVLPMAQWTRVVTNKFDLAGNYAVTNSFNAAVPQQFYRLGLP